MNDMRINFLRNRRADHLNPLLRYNETASEILTLIRANCPDANFIFGVGTSGQLFLPAIAALAPEFVWATIRKEGENRHSHHNVEFFWPKSAPDHKTLKGVFVDDLISSGKTLQYAARTVEKEIKEVIRAYDEQAMEISFEFSGAALYYCGVDWKSAEYVKALVNG